MSRKISVYLDPHINVKPLKMVFNICDFILSPYDHESSRRSDISWRLGAPSEVLFNDANWTFDEDNNAINDYVGSDLLPKIYSIIGSDPASRRDGLHLDSAYKSSAQFFLTEDKGIWNKRIELSSLLGFDIFNPSLESVEIITLIKQAAKN